MKLLHASREPGKIQRLRDALDRAGIPCMLRNELTSGLLPEIPLAEGIPAIWVYVDTQLPEAQRLLAALESVPAPTLPAWTCAHCGEIHEPQFDRCWKCGTGAPGSLPPQAPTPE